MAKAALTLANGTQVTIEGTPEEVASLLSKFAGPTAEKLQTSKTSTKTAKRPKAGVTEYVSQLIGSGFFKQPKELGSVKTALEERGHFYPITTLSPVLLRFVRQRELRRMKDKKRWVYVS
jgi:hypothetical protein